jgi:uncharacterized membrane protein YwzB
MEAFQKFSKNGVVAQISLLQVVLQVLGCSKLGKYMCDYIKLKTL